MVRVFKLVRVSCLLLAGMVGLAHATPAQAAAPGAVATITWGVSRAAIEQEIALLDKAGAQWIRANVNWTGLEPDRRGEINQWYLDDLDFAVAEAQRAGLKVIMPISDGVPYWASGDPDKYIDGSGKEHWDQMYPPARDADYGEIVRFVAEHFSPRGVHVYEIWNEPNSSWFWSPKPDPGRYTKLLQAGAAGVRAADPNATVLLGGLSHNDYDFLQGVYRAGGGDYFDGVAVHPYSWTAGPNAKWYRPDGSIAPDCFPAIKQIRRTMVRHGDGDKGVWVTEFGWSTTSGYGGVSKAKQAEFLKRGFRYLNRLPWVKVALWYSARNAPHLQDEDTYNANFGLFRADWQVKPSYKAFRAVAN